ncbi:hypothetical protein SKAU_G00128510 [Synaphobranchus kaupii]|uniref:Uncharacterized protein n=1 Tax=Synaphobranchus kaupii TaxID=118154 RepID=A0A9Q1FQL3_SYNKA|nr:hypothetical protein SKAU_G00128510 [Synaphobranchus kaupii]
MRVPFRRIRRWMLGWRVLESSAEDEWPGTENRFSRITPTTRAAAIPLTPPPARRSALHWGEYGTAATLPRMRATQDRLDS